MKAMHLYLVSGLLLCVGSVSGAETSTNPADAGFERAWGGLLISSAFRVDPDRPEVILPPANLREGDQLWIRPQRLYADEYLILQRCINPECSKSEVVRAWNVNGYMGPYPVLSVRVQVQSGGPYMLWMQHVPSPGLSSFRLYDRDAPPLVFVPVGSRVAEDKTAIQEAQAHGPEKIKRAQTEGASFVASFENGTTVRMQALRTPTP